MAYQVDEALVAQLSSNFNTAVVVFHGISEQVQTLDAWLSQWAAEVIAQPASLQGQDPVAQALGIALDRCQTITAPDCQNAAALATQYGNIVAGAWAAGGYVYSAEGQSPYAAPTPAGADTTTYPLPPASAPTPTPAPAPATVATAPPTTSAAAPTGAAATTGGKFLPRDLAGGAAGGAVAGLPEAGITFGISVVVGAILGGLFGSLFGGTDSTALNKAVQQLRQAMAQGFDEITRFAWAIGNAVAALWEAIATIWDNFFDALWTDLKAVWKALWKALSETIPTILKILHALRQKLDEIYVKYILKIMRWVQIARSFLIYLKLLHVPFAAKLDKIITQIQGAVFRPFLYVLQVLGIYGAWMNLVLNDHLTIQKPIFLNSMYEYQADWINMFWQAQSNPSDPAVQALTLGDAFLVTDYFTSQSAGPAQQPAPVEPNVDGLDSCVAFAQWALTGSGPIQQAADDGLQALLGILH